MGKHDKHDAVVNRSSEEFLNNRIKDLESRLEFANETIRKLQEQCGRMSKWASEIEANAEDKIAEKDAKIKTLEKAMSRMAEEIYGV